MPNWYFSMFYLLYFSFDICDWSISMLFIWHDDSQKFVFIFDFISLAKFAIKCKIILNLSKLKVVKKITKHENDCFYLLLALK